MDISTKTAGGMVLSGLLAIGLAGCGDSTGPGIVEGTYDMTAEVPPLDLTFDGSVTIDSIVGATVYGFWNVETYHAFLEESWQIGVTSGGGQEISLLAAGFYTDFIASHETVREGDRLRCVDYTISFSLDDNVDGTCSFSKR